jgi:hypothetical protein
MSKILEFKPRDTFLIRFEQKVEYWKGKLGLGLEDWRVISSCNSPLGPKDDLDFVTELNIFDKEVIIIFNTKVAKDPESNPEGKALEAVLAILLAPIWQLVNDSDREEYLDNLVAIIYSLRDCLRDCLMDGREDFK